LALVGGRDFHESPYDRATQPSASQVLRSSPFCFAAALEQGYSPSTMIDQLDTPIGCGGRNRLPEGEHEASAYTMRRALIVSAIARRPDCCRWSDFQRPYYARQLFVQN
jgi:membrane carboxypeptidase/penicillin-binding protein